jgi:hypothetical protein
LEVPEKKARGLDAAALDMSKVLLEKMAALDMSKVLLEKMAALDMSKDPFAKAVSENYLVL